MDRALRNRYIDILLDRYSDKLAVNDYKFILEDLSDRCISNDSSWDDKKESKDLFSTLYEIIPECINHITTFILDKLIQSNKTLESFKVPKEWDSIGVNAFMNSGLKTVEIEDGISEIESGAFRYCDELESITIPDSVKIISSKNTYSLSVGVFEGCKKLKNIILSANLRTIEQYTFENCSSLVAINLRNTLYLRRFAFHNCTSLKEVVMENPEAYVEPFYGYSDHPFGECNLAQLTIYARSEKIKDFCKRIGIKYIDLDKGEYIKWQK